MNINPQHLQNRPSPGQPWMPAGQGQGFGYQPGQQANQFMQTNTSTGSPKSSTGPPAMQNVPMFNAQNGSVTPPASLNPSLNNAPSYGNQMKQPQIDQVTSESKTFSYQLDTFLVMPAILSFGCYCFLLYFLSADHKIVHIY